MEEASAFIRFGKKILKGKGLGRFGSEPEGLLSFYLPDFFLQESSPWLNFPDAEEAEFSLEKPVYRTFEAPSASDFQSLVDGWEGEMLEKVVPYLAAKSASFSEEERLAVLARLAKSDQTLYAFWTKEEGMIGITPELLFARDLSEPKRIYSMALAGTKGDHATKESLFQDLKECHEHELVVRGIEEAFPGRVRRGERTILKAGVLQHLMTPLEIELEHLLSFEELIRRFHPTPALGTYPKERGKRWLKAYDEKVPRKRFGAPVGVRYQGKERMFVAIRQVQWQGDTMQLFAGAGVTKRSHLTKEYEEIQRKWNATWRLMSGEDCQVGVGSGDSRDCCLPGKA